MKPLRVMTEVAREDLASLASHAPHAPYIPNVFYRWNMLYADMSGNSPPCYSEFMELMNCASNKPSSECIPHYLKLMNCLRAQGFNNKPSED